MIYRVTLTLELDIEAKGKHEAVTFAHELLGELAIRRDVERLELVTEPKVQAR